MSYCLCLYMFLLRRLLLLPVITTGARTPDAATLKLQLFGLSECCPPAGRLPVGVRKQAEGLPAPLASPANAALG